MKHWQRFLMMVAAGVTAFVMAVPEADARRMGGGRSFGKQSDIVRQRNAPAQPPAGQAARQQPPGNAAAAGGNRWLGPIGGLAAGLGLAWLASSLGLSEEFGTIILIGLLAALGFMLYRRLVASQRRPALQGAGGPMLREQMPRHPMAGPGGGGAGAAAVDTMDRPIGVPADFDVDGFVHQAKVQFIRLQAVFDAGDLKDLREFTSPEVFAELRLQLEQDGGASQRTDVVQLDAELLGIETTPSEYIASVRYTGMLREEAGQSAEAFEEIWNLAKPRQGSGGWILAGIQQVE
ncbi:MAG: Tim44-like domain-containing protein [Burkholderiaceae bacterium]